MKTNDGDKRQVDLNDLFFRQLSVGDVVELADGSQGEITEFSAGSVLFTNGKVAPYGEIVRNLTKDTDAP